MKTFLALFAFIMLMAFMPSNTCQAQIVSTHIPTAAKDTLTNTDNTTISIPVDNISRSVELYGLKRSGNVSSCLLILQGSVDGTNYVAIDTLALADVTTNVKVVALRSSGQLFYKTYRAYASSAGTCTWEPRVYLLRRNY